MRIPSLGAAILLVIGVIETACGQTQTVTLFPTKDNTLFFDAAGALSGGATPSVFVGTNVGGVIRRAVMAFDLTQIPPGSTIQTASLNLFMAQTISGANDIDVYALAQTFGEGASGSSGGGGGGGSPAQAGDATWLHTSFPGSFWVNPGGFHVLALSATTTVSGVGAYSFSSAAMAADVQAWLNGTTLNAGWLLRSNDEFTVPSAKRFESKESTNVANRPRLVVTYLPPSASVSSVGVGCTGLSGQPFTLGTVGVPSLGNATFAVTLSGGQPSNPFFLFLAADLAAVPLPLGGCNFIHLELISAQNFINLALSPIGPIPLNPSGGFILAAPIANTPSLLGQKLAVQALAIDDPLAGTSVLSNGLLLTFGI